MLSIIKFIKLIEMRFCFSLFNILYLSLLLFINPNELKFIHILNGQSIKENHSLVICKEVCVKLENCLSDRWLVCSWNELGVKPETVCCLYSDHNSKLSNKVIALQTFCEYKSRNSQRFNSQSSSLLKRITFGMSAKDGQFPWMASIFMFGQFLCGATIISDNFCVTAAHCFVPLFDASVYRLRVGSNILGKGQEYLISKITVHELFFASESYHDIALVLTKFAFELNNRVKFICIPNHDMTGDNLSGLMATVVGFGNIAYMGFFSQTLQQIEVPIISNTKCAQIYANLDRRKIPIGIQECMICAGTQNSGRDACQGDSGGPMTVTVHGMHYLIGIVSFGHKCGTLDFPGVYTNIAYYRNWILEVMSKHERYISS